MTLSTEDVIHAFEERVHIELTRNFGRFEADAIDAFLARQTGASSLA